MLLRTLMGLSHVIDFGQLDISRENLDRKAGSGLSNQTWQLCAHTSP